MLRLYIYEHLQIEKERPSRIEHTYSLGWYIDEHLQKEKRKTQLHGTQSLQLSTIPQMCFKRKMSLLLLMKAMAYCLWRLIMR